MTNRIHPKVLKGQLDNLLHELAILDVREQGVFAQGHLLFASNTPLSRLEIEVPRLVPRRSSPIVLYGDGNEREDLALRANELLNHFGYSNVSTLEGGVRGWRKAGYELFSGINEKNFIDCSVLLPTKRNVRVRDLGKFTYFNCVI